MKKYIFIIASVIATLPVSAQSFNFTLRTNNQQLIDEALLGAFVRINQSYELCDTVRNEHFGRDGKDYFSIIPFIGVETERGLLCSSDIEQPWVIDNDYKEYEGQYKPIVTESTISVLNDKTKNSRLTKILKGAEITNGVSLIEDPEYSQIGLKADTVAGAKDGWFVWFSSQEGLSNVDSVRFTSIRKTIEISSNATSLQVEAPDLSESIYGGIYITPKRTAIGQITFYLTGVVIMDEMGYKLVFPFIEPDVITTSKVLTPIGIVEDDKLNQLKKKRK